MSAHDESVGRPDPDILCRVRLRQDAIRSSLAAADGHRRHDAHRKKHNALPAYGCDSHGHDIAAGYRSVATHSYAADRADVNAGSIG